MRNGSAAPALNQKGRIPCALFCVAQPVLLCRNGSEEGLSFGVSRTTCQRAVPLRKAGRTYCYCRASANVSHSRLVPNERIAVRFMALKASKDVPFGFGRKANTHTHERNSGECSLVGTVGIVVPSHFFMSVRKSLGSSILKLLY